jgi:transposase-like protein
VARRGPRFTEEELRWAIAGARSWSETLRRLDYRSAGGNWKTLQKYAALWEIPTDHFDPDAGRVEALKRANRPTPLEEVMVAGSTYSRSHLKRRLFAEGIKDRRCEMCGQDEIWHGRKMALILDHINGIPNDHRLENLRILCPNCAATLGTHCGAKNRRTPRSLECGLCGRQFIPKSRSQKYCSRECGQRIGHRGPRHNRRKVERPPYDQLVREIEESSYLAVGRKYGVSDNAVRKWVRFYETELSSDEALGELDSTDEVAPVVGAPA